MTATGTPRLRDYRPLPSRAKPDRQSCTRGAPGARAMRIVALLRSGITCEVKLAEASGSPRSYVQQVLAMPAKLFPK